MNVNRGANCSGMTLMELLVVLSGLALITAVGAKFTATCLTALEHSIVSSIERSALEGFREGVTRAWDQRARGETPEDPWLEIFCQQVDSDAVLKLLRIRNRTVHGETIWLEWASPYRGRTVVSGPTGSFPQGDIPQRLAFSFPDAREKVMRQGFAIRAVW